MGMLAKDIGHQNLLFSLGALKRRWSGKIEVGSDRENTMVLTRLERKELVEYLLKRNRTAKGIKPSNLSPLVIDILKARVQANKKGGRKHIPLSHNARLVLEKGKVGQKWFDLFHAEYEDELKRRTPQPISVQRAIWCTEAIVSEHFKRLANLLIRTGIMVEVSPGQFKIDAKRVLCKDEMPQVLDGGSGAGRGNKQYCGVKDICRKLQQQNREHTTVDCTTGMDGHIYWPHFNISNKYIYDNMVVSEERFN
eukprot:Lithocolla_globosa_v1_NODE_257_length_4779_cov_60.829103.p1 type:complete len:252 gc:universal NODE_257_length_4779_cov_60.829103:1954-2709(+)